MDLILGGFSDALNLATILYVAMGVFVGVVVGAIPGLNGPMAIALAVPLTYTMGPVTAIGFLMGISKGSSFGGSIAAVCINTPGAAAAVATTLDGYPLAKQGKARKAMKLCLYSSFVGECFSTILLIGVAGPIASMALKMGPSEIFLLIVFSLVMISGLTTASMAKGIFVASTGMLISTIGIDPVVGMPRLTFDIYQFEAGFSLVGITIGLLALSEILLQSEQLTSKNGADKGLTASIEFSPKREDNRISWQEFKSCFGTMIRSSGIGAVIGAMPGLGAAIAAFMAYGAAKKASRAPEEFGKGTLQGLAAPESANNAVAGAALIPLFTLGIPGCLSTALLIGVFIMHGMTVGPLLFEQQGRMVYGIYGTMVIGNFALIAAGMLGIRIFTKVLLLPKQILYPVIMFICLVGAYLSEQALFSVGVTVSCALLGYLMKKFAFPFVSFVIGFILGPSLELSLQQTVIAYSSDYMEILRRPISLALLLALAVFFIWKLIPSLIFFMQKRKA